MLTIIQATKFKKDLKKIKLRNLDLEKLRECLNFLVNKKTLPTKYKDHPLKGNFFGYRDLHIEPDWLLIYKTDAKHLYLARTGSHADLF